MAASTSARNELFTATELAVQLAGFRNVDLFSQGIYQLRISAVGSRSKRVAIPTEVREGRATSGPPREHMLPAHMLELTNEFCSPAFRVRYVEEEVRASPHAPTPPPLK